MNCLSCFLTWFQVNARNIDGSTPLCDACAAGNLECVKLLLEYGAMVNPPLFTFSPLHEACMGGKIRCFSSVCIADRVSYADRFIYNYAGSPRAYKLNTTTNPNFSLVQSIHPTIQPSVHPHIPQFIHPSIRLSTHTSICFQFLNECKTNNYK